MSKVVHKYPVIIGENVLTLPQGSEIISFQAQHGGAVVWALVDQTQEETECIVLHVVMTGQPFGFKVKRCIGTVQLNNGGFVLHALEAV